MYSNMQYSEPIKAMFAALFAQHRGVAPKLQLAAKDEGSAEDFTVLLDDIEKSVLRGDESSACRMLRSCLYLVDAEVETALQALRQFKDPSNTTDGRCKGPSCEMQATPIRDVRAESGKLAGDASTPVGVATWNELFPVLEERLIGRLRTVALSVDAMRAYNRIMQDRDIHAMVDWHKTHLELSDEDLAQLGAPAEGATPIGRCADGACEVRPIRDAVAEFNGLPRPNAKLAQIGEELLSGLEPTGQAPAFLDLMKALQFGDTDGAWKVARVLGMQEGELHRMLVAQERAADSIRKMLANPPQLRIVPTPPAPSEAE